MAVRSATLHFDKLVDFLKAWKTTLSEGAAFLPAGTAEGELAKEFKLDLVLPVAGRVGPLNAQVVHTTPDGGTGVRLIETPADVQARLDGYFAFLDEVKAWLQDSGQLVDPATIPKAPPRPIVQPQPSPAAPQAASPAASAPVHSAAPDPGAARPRGLLLPDIGDRDPDLSGDLADRSLRDALVKLAVDRTTGLLTVVKQGGQRKFGFWHKGGPVGWRSEPIDQEEVLGVLLFRSGNITKEQLAESLKIMNQTGGRQGEALIEMGVVNYGQLVMILQKQVEFVLQRLMGERDGVWGFHALERLPEPFVNPPLRVPALLYRALKEHGRGLRLEELYKSQKHLLDRYIGIREGVEPILEELKLKPTEHKLTEVIRGTSWRLRELFSVSPLSRQETAIAIWALNELRFLDFGESEDLQRYLARVASRVLTKAQNLNKCNHFDVLEVHWICLDDDVEAAHRKLTKEFDPASYHDLTPELERAFGRLGERVEAAYAVLRDRNQRRAYRETTVEASMIVQSAELLGKKGEMAIMKKDYREANMCWSKALELVPNRGEYREGYQRAQALRRGFS